MTAYRGRWAASGRRSRTLSTSAAVSTEICNPPSQNGMEVVGALSNQDLQGQLRRLVTTLAAIRTGGAARERRSCRQRPRRPGWVVKAIVKVLAEQDEPMRAKDIHAAVEALVGEPVRWSSVKQALATHVAGPSQRFVRIARGRYVLARTT